MVNRCRNGDRSAMESVYRAYKSPFLNLACRFTGEVSQAEDLIQDIFIKVFTKIKKLKSPEAFNAWAFRIAANTCMSFRRKRVKSSEVSLDDMGHIPVQEESDVLLKKQLENAIAALPAKQKIVFELHDVQGLTHSEIAGIMKSTEGTAKSQLFKARMKIRNFLRGE